MSFSSPERFTAKRTTNLSLVMLRGSSCAVCRAISYSAPRPLDEPTLPQHIVFALEPEPEEENCELLRQAVQVLRPGRVTIVVTDRPFAPAIAASRGEEPRDLEARLEDLADSLAEHKVEVEGRVVTCITGYTLCDTIEELEVDLLVVKAEPDGSLPIHMDWLYQVIPTRLLRVRERRKTDPPTNTSLGRLSASFNQL